ncbi:uncharacterized protein DC041_0000208 [Schistosoma bovis]|uniref:AP180 N-terminal homology (ANTH) domain-containing protein n=1 Tax=Schistosoma bovis TaxID=6184 RepID=A0A430Q454_SCHBO|nr:uncharacterized protein DC041_0000208 [Schistosoma bovis]
MLLWSHGSVFIRRDDGVLRTMPVDKLLKALPVMQSQILTLLEFDALEKDLNNAIINAAFLLLYKDLIRLFASYNEGMINLIGKLFNISLALEKDLNNAIINAAFLLLYKDLIRLFASYNEGMINLIGKLFNISLSLGIGDKDSLGLQPVPEKVIQAMEQHLQILESKKGSDDEDEETHTSTKPNVPKKPTLPVPIPSQTVISTEANKISSHNPPNRNRDYNDAAESINKTHDSNILDQSEQLNDDTTEPTVASYPTLVLNDEVFDDLLALDPLLEKDSVSGGTTTTTTTKIPVNNPPTSFNNSLPPGLKPVPSTVPIRPAVVMSASQNKNPLDALDSTLSNLASSLGGQQTWGSTNLKVRFQGVLGLY